MSLEAFDKFLASNPEATEKVKTLTSYAEVAEFAKKNGFDVSAAEITKACAEVTAELDDDALEAVAGGAWSGDAPGGAPVNPFNPGMPGGGGGGLPPYVVCN